MTTWKVPKKGVGLPDYSAPKPTGAVPVGPVWTSTDVGELAARLGSCDVFDRRGNVIFIEDFRNGINSVSHDALASWVNDIWKIGGHSLRLTIPANNAAGIVVAIPYPYISRMGFEFTFTYHGNIDYIFPMIVFGTLSDEYYASIKWNGDTPAWGSVGGLYYQTGPDSAPPLLTSYTHLPPNLELRGWDGVAGNEIYFHTLKLVTNFMNGFYSRLLADGQFYQMDNFPMYKEPVGVYPGVNFYFIVRTPPGGGCDFWIDNIIITQNEPENPKE